MQMSIELRNFIVQLSGKEASQHRNNDLGDQEGIFFQRVYHAHDVVKMVKFVCRAAKSEQHIDWETLKRSMKHYVTLKNTNHPATGFQSLEMVE